MKIFVKVSYIGTAYCGYQVQPNGVTVQEKLNEAAKALFGVDCDIVGCSRTDSGVHARCFCATISQKGTGRLETQIPIEKIPSALNVRLPEDISVLSACAVSADFHARYDVVSKEYEYLICNRAQRDPFLRDRAWHIPAPFSEDALARMREVAKCFIGKKDFSAFRDKGADTEPEDAVREVYLAQVTCNGDMISFRVCANGFLYHMVRIMVGTLVAAARGRINVLAVRNAIESGDRRLLGMTAPACGLYLDRVVYGDFPELS